MGSREVCVRGLDSRTLSRVIQDWVVENLVGIDSRGTGYKKQDTAELDTAEAVTVDQFERIVTWSLGAAVVTVTIGQLEQLVTRILGAMEVVAQTSRRGQAWRSLETKLK